MELQLGDFAVARLIEDVAATTAPLAKSNGNRLVIRVDPNLGRMSSNQLRLRQAAINLMSNAAKFTCNGLIELSARRLRLESGDWIEIEVRDTEIGIGRDELKTIFQNYKQVNSIEARKRKGTGLGLALSQKLCMMMGGNIFADSELGHGSRFSIRVPAILSGRADRTTRLESVEAPIGALCRRNAGRGNSMSVFHPHGADDAETGVGRTYTFARPTSDRRRHGKRSRGAVEPIREERIRDRRGGLRRGSEARPEQTVDVILLDVTMPDMNGTEVLRRIRKKFSASHLPVIMVTPNSQAEDVIEAMKIGANDYVTNRSTSRRPLRG